MTHISKCEHGVYMALCRKCFPGQVDVEFNKDDYCSPQLKTLTDEEIDSLADEFGAGMEQFGGCFRHVDFAMAILRKAQEK